MEIEKLGCEFTVCKVRSIPPHILETPFCFVGKTDEELSLVCATEDGWRAFRIRGVLDFSLVGILAPIADILAENRIGIFAVSTYNTDYVLVKSESFDRAMSLLADAGYIVI